MTTAKKKPEKAKTEVSKADDVPAFRSRAERLAAGKSLCDSVPRNSHAGWKPPANRRDPIAILFALAYADQTERDHAALVEAVRSGRLEALVEE